MLLMSLYATILFFLLSPGILFTLPPSESVFASTGLHALLYGVIWQFTHKPVYGLVSSLVPAPPCSSCNGAK